MVGDDFWTFLFSQFRNIYLWMVNTPAVTFTPSEGETMSVSFFALYITYLVVQVLISVGFFFVKYGSSIYDAFSDDD